jgi:hypothetical protein
VRDLIKEGALYANSRKAFHCFTWDTQKPEKRGFDKVEGEPEDKDDNEQEDQDEYINEYHPTEDDLRVDVTDEEFLLEPEELLAAALEIADSALVDSDADDE